MAPRGFAAAYLIALVLGIHSPASAQSGVTPAEARAIARLPSSDGVAPVPSVMRIGSRLMRSKGYVAWSTNGPDIGATARHRSG